MKRDRPRLQQAIAGVLVLLMTLSVSAVVPALAASPSTSGSTTKSSTLVVDHPDDGLQCPKAGYIEINNAIAAASSGDTIRVCAGKYTKTTVDKKDLTLKADGDANIVPPIPQKAVIITKSGVSVRGFDIRTSGANYAIVVGGQDALIRGNNINATDGGAIFLSDGAEPFSGASNPNLNPATGSRVVKNTIAADEYRVFSDADRTDIVDNTIEDIPPPSQQPSMPSTQPNNPPPPSNTSILVSGNDTLVKENRVKYEGEYRQDGEQGINLSPAVQIGLAGDRNENRNKPSASPPAGHNMSLRTTVANNNIFGASEAGIWLRRGAKGSVVRDNMLTSLGMGVAVYSNNTTVRSNTIIDTIGNSQSAFFGVTAFGDGIAIVGYEATVKNNFVTQASNGIVVGGNATVVGNMLSNNANQGIYISYDCSHCNWGGAGSGDFVNNTLRRNAGSGVAVPQQVVREANDSPVYEIDIHNNTFIQNARFGVHNINFNPLDGDWPVVDARNNYWGDAPVCGPSSGLRDPDSQTRATGSGDQVSAGDVTNVSKAPGNVPPVNPGVSNVNFAPWLEDPICP